MALSIDKASRLIEAFAKIISQVATLDKDKDGSISIAEIITFVQAFIMEAVAVYGDFSTALQQLRDADGEDRKLLVTTFADKFELPNNDAEVLIEDWIFHVIDTAELVGATIDVIKK